jgi:hypothetical protein
VGVFLPDGILFEVSAAEGDEAGLWRSRYELNGDVLTLFGGGADCFDTMGEDSCEPTEVSEDLEVLELTATSLHLYTDVDPQDVQDYAYTKITP